MSKLARIVKAMGGALTHGGRRALIRGPGHGPEDRSVSLAETEDGRILIHCFSPKDDWRSVRDALHELGLLDDTPTQRAQDRAKQTLVQPADEDRRARAMRWWEEAKAVHASLAERYLRIRGVAGADRYSEALRFHPAVTSLEDHARRPALVVRISDEGDELQGVQVTLLSAHGAAKAALKTPRRTIGRLHGGVVRLGKPSSTLVIAEGVETALSAAEALLSPTWAALSADNLARFDPPPSVAHLIIAADNDEPGHRAAAALQQRLKDRVETSLAPPPPQFNDWNDWARNVTSP